MPSEEVTLFRASAQGRNIEAIDLQEIDGQGGRHAWRIHELPPGQPESAHFIVATTDADPVLAVVEIDHEESESSSQEVKITLSSPAGPHVTYLSA